MPNTDIKIEYQYFYTTKEWATLDGEHKHQKEPRITVCYIRTEVLTAVGIAICGPRDNPCRKTGKKIARQRAQHALGLAMEQETFYPGTILRSHWIARNEAYGVYFDDSDISLESRTERGVADTKVRCYRDPKYRMTRLTK